MQSVVRHRRAQRLGMASLHAMAARVAFVCVAASLGPGDHEMARSFSSLNCIGEPLPAADVPD